MKLDATGLTLTWTESVEIKDPLSGYTETKTVEHSHTFTLWDAAAIKRLLDRALDTQIDNVRKVRQQELTARKAQLEKELEAVTNELKG